MRKFINTNGETCFEVPYNDIIKLENNIYFDGKESEFSAIDIEKYRKLKVARAIGETMFYNNLINIKEEKFNDGVIMRFEVKIIKPDESTDTN
jgi:hypothetical protein